MRGDAMRNDIVPPAIVKSSPAELEQLAYEINEAHNATETACRKTLERAKEVGILLLKALNLVPYKEKGNWLKNNVNFSQPTAWRYMKLAKTDFTLFTVNKVEQSLATFTEEVS